MDGLYQVSGVFDFVAKSPDGNTLRNKLISALKTQGFSEANFEIEIKLVEKGREPTVKVVTTKKPLSPLTTAVKPVDSTKVDDPDKPFKLEPEVKVKPAPKPAPKPNSVDSLLGTLQSIKERKK